MSTPRKSPANRPPRPSRSRTEVQEGFQKLQAETTSDLDPRSIASAEARKQYLQASFRDLSPQAVAERFTSLQLETTRALASVQEQVTAELTKLSEVREAVEVEKQELEKLHGIDLAATSIKILVDDHETKQRALDEEHASHFRDVQKRTKELEEAYTAKKAQLENGRRREEDAYTYKTTQERRAASDAFTQEERELSRKAADEELSRKKQWAAKEEELEKRTTTLATKEAEVTARAASVEKETDKAVAIATNSLKKDYDHRIALLEARGAAELQLEKSRTEALAQQVAALTAQLKANSDALDKARQQITETATKAFDSMSGQSALASVQQVVKDNGAGGRGSAKS